MITLEDIRFKVERDIQDQLDNESVIDWSNVAQNEFLLRITLPGSLTLAIDTTSISYDLSAYAIREFRRFRLQSDIDNGFNRNFNPVYTFYNGTFEVPSAFPADDDLLIDYYGNLRFFTAIDDEIDLDDRFYPLYTTFIKMMYYQLPSVVEKLGVERAEMRYQSNMNMHNVAKKQVADFYLISNGIEKPRESGWECQHSH